jgi:hypothetical protein
MSVLEDLSEEECYLHARRSDPSGLDLAEFCWYDAEAESNVWRAWPFQWRWFRNTAPLQIDQCGRSVGKSLSIKLRAFCFPFLHPGQEMVVTAPELVHLNPIVGLVENQFRSTRLGKEMLPKGRNQGITHRPFQMDFLNGSRIIGRIPQRDGKGVKGIHPLWLELDEGQDYPEPGWVEVIETLKRGHEGAVWRAHGVTKGVRDYFYKFTQPNSGWTVHRYTAMHRPTWSMEERNEKIESYGSRDHPDYRRNILGLHGDATNPLFVLHRLMQCVDQDESSEYNQDIYQYYRINHEYLLDVGTGIVNMLDFPASHKALSKVFWAGMDVGYTNHPSEILIFAETKEKGKDASVLRLVSRIHLERIGHGSQVDAILHVMNWYNVKAFAMDKTGLGLPLFQDIQERAPGHAPIIKGYNFSSKILVDIDATVEVDEYRGDLIKEAGIERNVLEYASDKLREYVDTFRLRLPWDRELIGEFQGQTYTVVRDTMNMYGKREYSKGTFHALDAARMAVLGKVQTPIEQFVKKDTFTPVMDVFLSG